MADVAELLSEEVWLLRILDTYLNDPADWARWSATCRRFRRLGNPLCLQLVATTPHNHPPSQRHGSTSDTLDATNTLTTAERVLPQYLFLEVYRNATTGGNSTGCSMVRVQDVLPKEATNDDTKFTDKDSNQTSQYRLWTYHAPTRSRAYLTRNHRYPNRTRDDYIYGLAFQVDIHHRKPNISINEKDQYWTMIPKYNPDKDASLLALVNLQICGTSTSSSPSMNTYSMYSTAPRSLRMEARNHWFVPCNDGEGSSGILKPYQPGRCSGETAIGNIPFQPCPFLSHNGGLNIYKPRVWSLSKLKAHPGNSSSRNNHNNIQQYLIPPSNGGRYTGLYFYTWIQDSYFYCHAQYLVFPLRLPIFVEDEIPRSSSSTLEEPNDEPYQFLCHYFWKIFFEYHHRRQEEEGHGVFAGRWMALADYFSRAATELSRLQSMARRHVAVTGRNDFQLPPPARTDDMPDAVDDGSMGLTVTHAANTWSPPPPSRHHCSSRRDGEEEEYRTEYTYRACRVEDPNQPPQHLNWNNVLELQCRRLRRIVSTGQGDSSPSNVRPTSTRTNNNEQLLPLPLDMQAPNLPKDTSQPAWSMSLYA